jgi:hypothetical protein
MLAGAEPDFEPDRATRGAEEGTDVETTRFRNIYCQLRQRCVDAGLLPRAQRPPAAPAEDVLTTLRLAAGASQKARRNSSARSSLSQEKPPSGSGGRPKWP